MSQVPFRAQISDVGQFFLFDSSDDDNQFDELFASQPGISDRYCNMISLSPQLHGAWIERLFALKYLSTTEDAANSQ